MASQCGSRSNKGLIVCSLLLASALYLGYKHVANNSFQNKEQQNQLVNVMFKDKLEQHRKVQPPGTLTHRGK